MTIWRSRFLEFCVGLGREDPLKLPGALAPWSSPFADIFEEIDAFDELHREEPVVSVRDELVEVDQVRVADVEEGAEFLLEAVERRGAGPLYGLECHLGSALAVVGTVDDPHPAPAEHPGDVVVG